MLDEASLGWIEWSQDARGAAATAVGAGSDEDELSVSYVKWGWGGLVATMTGVDIDQG